MATKTRKQFNIRLPGTLIEKLGRMAGPGEGAASLGARAIEEWIRMMEMPGIDFRVTPSGREPHITGTGLSIWELFLVWKDHGEDTAKVLKNYPHLTSRQVEAAVRYAGAFGDEMPQGFPGAVPTGVKHVKI